MWFRVAEEMHLRVDDVVGFFGPDALPSAEDAGEDNEAGEAGGAVGGRRAGGNHSARGAGQVRVPGRTGNTARAFALMKDGSIAPAPFGVRALADRFKRAQDELKTITTGEEWQKPKSRP